MTKTLNVEAARARATLINDGAAAAREGRHRTENPHAVGSDDWTNWSEGFDQQEAWSRAGRGAYHVATDTALVPKD